MQRISEHEPRKGTETPPPLGASSYFFFISEHEPRKGTETFLRGRCSGFLIYNFRTRTPKGDGNSTSFSAVCFSTFSISEHEPRKGTETAAGVLVYVALCLFQNTNPERGRKPAALSSFSFSAANFRTRTPKGDGNGISAPIISYLPKFQNTNPERGRKPELNVLYTRARKKFQNTNPERGRKRTTPFSL